MKRKASLELIDDEAWQFIIKDIEDGSYRVATFEDLTTHPYNALLDKFLQKLDYQKLKSFEKVSRLTRQLVAQWNTWKYLVERDYPQRFSIVNDNGTVRAITQQRLDALSMRPHRSHTYWKRYYEFLTRAVEVQKPNSMFEVVATRGGYTGAQVRFFLTTNSVIYTMDNVARNVDGVVVPLGNTVEVDYDALRTGVTFVDDGLLTHFQKIDKSRIILWKTEFEVVYEPLVSQKCSVCETPTRLECSCCKVVYCGKSCQAVHQHI